jgi:hypothetical protein
MIALRIFVLLMVLGLLSVSRLSYAQTGVTTGGYVACLSKEWLDDFVKFSVAKDYGSMQAYLNTKCFQIKEGVVVTITEYPGMFGGVTGFVFNGVKFWTVREGIKTNIK